MATKLEGWGRGGGEAVVATKKITFFAASELKCAYICFFMY